MINGTGWRRDRVDPRDAIYRHQLAPNAIIDETVDYPLASLPAMQFPIYHQRQTGSCVAQSVGRNVEYLMRSQGVFDFHPSRLFVYWCARAVIGEQSKDAGCEIRDAFNTIAAFGVPHEEIWPFEEYYLLKRPPRQVFKDAVDHTALVRQKVPQKLNHILSCLKHRLPVVFGTATFDSWDTGTYIPLPTTGEKPTGYHAILITGWRADTKQFQFVNSWGKDWGENGYGYLPVDYVLNPDLSADFWSAFLMSKTDEEKKRK